MSERTNKEADEYSDPEETALRSGKGRGFLYRLLFDE